MKVTKADLIREKAIRELEKRHQDKQASLVSFIEYFFQEELNKPFQTNWHHQEIAEALEKVLTGEITRLIINIPPGSGKTELITKCFPVWAMGKKPDLQIIATGYSAQLTQNFGAQARDYYRSTAFKRVFPRRPDIRVDQDTKGLWKNEAGGQYLATGTGGSITGNRANIFIIDDPLKPDEALSDVKREAINRWYDNTVLSRLFNPNTDAVIIVAQRVHENDLCGYLMEKEKKGTGEKWHKIVVKAIAEGDELKRQVGESYHIDRMPTSALAKMRLNDPITFSTQYQQEPVNKDTQEFHEEFYKYYNKIEDIPKPYRIFTTVDPAFKTQNHNDESAIITGAIHKDKMYILELTHGRYDASQLIEKIIYHVTKWNPEQVGIEAYQAQTVIAQFLKNKMRELGRSINISEIIQTGDKETKIRALIAPIKDGRILWRADMVVIEEQLRRFPRGAHDDVIDALQMLYSMVQLQPNTEFTAPQFSFTYDQLGRPVWQ